MSWQSQEAVFLHSASKNAARLVLLAIAYHADEKGTTSYPSIKTLQSEANLSERSVYYALKTLVESGELHSAVGLVATKEHPYTINLPHGTAKFAVEVAADIAVEEDVLQILQPEVQTLQQVTANPAVDVLQTLQNEVQILQLEPSFNPLTIKHSEEPSLNRPTAREGALRTLLKDSAEAKGSRYSSFDEFFGAFWRSYRKEGKVDKDLARNIARDIVPSEWDTVVDCAVNCSLSTEDRKVRNAANFLRGESYMRYADGPIHDMPKLAGSDAKAAAVTPIVQSAQKARAAFESNGHKKLHHGGTSNGRG